MQEVIVIGAARSGTKILRDTIKSSFDLGVVPYDIEYIWRHGRRPAQLHHDALQPGTLSSSDITYIRRFIQRYGLGQLGVVEKTVANALRIPFVHEVFPDAQYVHLVRDGVDVVQSAITQWNSPADLLYIARKLAHFPMRFAPRYGFDYATRTLLRRTSTQPQSWGPRYVGLKDDLSRERLEVICARQWVASVRYAEAGFATIGKKPFTIRYEDFVREPVGTLRQLGTHFEWPIDPSRIARSASRVARPRPRSAFGSDEVIRLLGEEMDPTLIELDYDAVPR